MSRRRTIQGALAGLAFLSSCTVGPEFRPDKMKLPEQFSDAPHPATGAEIKTMEAGLKDWWRRFGDPVLDDLIERALKGNYDLKVATQRILAEQAVRNEAKADWYPQLDVNAGGGNNRFSTNVNNWPMRPHAGAKNSVGTGPGKYSDASILTYGAKASWEIDVFGRISRQVQVQTRLLEATIEDRRAVLLALLSQVATDYVILRGTQERIRVAEAAIKVAQDDYDLVNRLFSHGVGNNLVLAQAASELHSEKARLPLLKAQEEAMKHALNVLMGDMPGTEIRPLDEFRPMPKMPDFPSALPSSVLVNRPDIREAERRYAMGMAEIGVAVAQLYPNFSVPLNFNPNASAFYQMAQLYSMSWNFMMMASIPVLHGGKLTAQIRQARAEAEASRLNYRQTVLSAFQEVEDRMDEWVQNAATVGERNEAWMQAAVARDRAGALFQHGLTSFLDVLTTEQTALSSKDNWVQSRMKRLEDAISLYVAIGAGWQGDALSAQLPVTERKQSILARAFMR